MLGMLLAKYVTSFTNGGNQTPQNASCTEEEALTLTMVASAHRAKADLKLSPAPVEQLELTNQGDLCLYFVGTGAAFAKTLNQNNVIVVKGEDHVAIDCGTKFSQALYDLGTPVSRLENFVITHSHADHIGGLEEVQLYGRYVSQIKPRMVINHAYQKILWEQSLRGGSEMSESRPLRFEDLWEVIRPVEVKGAPRETWEANVGGINLKLPRTMHYPDDAVSWRESQWSCAVIIDERILFTSDTRFDEELLLSFDALYNFDFIFHDCQLFTGGVHASINELSTLPDDIKSRIILTHYGDNFRDFEKQARDAGFLDWARQGHCYRFPTPEAAVK